MFNLSPAIERAQDAIKDYWCTGYCPPRLTIGTPHAYFAWFDARESVMVYLDSKGRVEAIR